MLRCGDRFYRDTSDCEFIVLEAQRMLDKEDKRVVVILTLIRCSNPYVNKPSWALTSVSRGDFGKLRKLESLTIEEALTHEADSIRTRATLIGKRIQIK